MIDRRSLPLLDAMPYPEALSRDESLRARAQYTAFLGTHRGELRGWVVLGSEALARGTIARAWPGYALSFRSAWSMSQEYGNCVVLRTAITLSDCALRHGARIYQYGRAVAKYEGCASCSIGRANARRLSLPVTVNE